MKAFLFTLAGNAMVIPANEKSDFAEFIIKLSDKDSNRLVNLSDKSFEQLSRYTEEVRRKYNDAVAEMPQFTADDLLRKAWIKPNCSARFHVRGHFPIKENFSDDDIGRALSLFELKDMSIFKNRMEAKSLIDEYLTKYMPIVYKWYRRSYICDRIGIPYVEKKEIDVCCGREVGYHFDLNGRKYGTKYITIIVAYNKYCPELQTAYPSRYHNWDNVKK